MSETNPQRPAGRDTHPPLPDGRGSDKPPLPDGRGSIGARFGGATRCTAAS